MDQATGDSIGKMMREIEGSNRIPSPYLLVGKDSNQFLEELAIQFISLTSKFGELWEVKPFHFS